MNSLSRRGLFVKAAGAAGCAAVSLTAARVLGANQRIVLGIVGCGGRGSGLARTLAAEPTAKVAYVCDPDEGRREQVKAAVGADQAVGDLRRVLDDKGVDAVVVATPDHWHAPAALLAIAAGKHVYVEKPCSHNFRESQLLLAAAGRHQRIVQHGTQSRSDPFVNGAIRLLREGVIGDVLMAKAWDVQRRNDIGHAAPASPPEGVDYDLWVGPAENMPYQSNRFHYNWHWWHNFGTGDVGNDGTHDIDIARWGLGVDTLPSRISGLGGKYFFDDDQQFPDTATVVYEYPGDGKVGSLRQLIFEMRIWSTNYPLNCDSGNEFYGTKGKMFLSKRGKLEILGERNVKLDVPTGELQLPSHQQDFLEAIRSGRNPVANLDEAHRSVALVHLGNISVRLGRSLSFDPKTEQIVGDDEAARLLRRTYREGGHWAVPQGV